jgi:hypothetical protein
MIGSTVPQLFVDLVCNEVCDRMVKLRGFFTAELADNNRLRQVSGCRNATP